MEKRAGNPSTRSDDLLRPKSSLTRPSTLGKLLGEPFVHSKLLARNGLYFLKGLVEVSSRHSHVLGLLLGLVRILSLPYQLSNCEHNRSIRDSPNVRTSIAVSP